MQPILGKSIKTIQKKISKITLADHPSPLVTFEWFFREKTMKKIKEVKMKRQVEVFTANCPVCDPVVNMVKELACDQCEITIYDLIEQCEDRTCLNKLEKYQIKKVPAIAVNGKLLDCCQDQGISQEELIKAGIGQG